MDKRAEFEELFKELEKEIRQRYKLGEETGAIAWLAYQPQFSHIKNKLDYCRKVRNIFAHEQNMPKGFAIEISEGMVAFLKSTLDKIKHPKRAKDIMRPVADVYTQTREDAILPAMRLMQEKVYTHIPIMQDGIVVGVFSENTLLSSVVKDSIVGVDETTTFKDFDEFLPVDKHVAESFRFIKPNVLKNQLEAEFANAVKEVDRIGMVFVTDNGEQTGKLLGIITVWDIPED